MADLNNLLAINIEEKVKRRTSKVKTTLYIAGCAANGRWKVGVSHCKNVLVGHRKQ
jgi:hypothetical protein